MEGRSEIPLFPLGDVLLKGARIRLNIFEPRYLDMVGRCMRESEGFGVVLIREGREARRSGGDPQPTIFNIGTHAKIVDFDSSESAQLQIVIHGGAKFRIHRTWARTDHLLCAEVEYLPDERAAAIGDEFRHLVELLRALLQHPEFNSTEVDIDFEDACAVSWRLSEYLPLEPEIKQSLLQMHLPRERLAEFKRIVNKLRG